MRGVVGVYVDCKGCERTYYCVMTTRVWGVRWLAVCCGWYGVMVGVCTAVGVRGLSLIEIYICI